MFRLVHLYTILRQRVAKEHYLLQRNSDQQVLLFIDGSAYWSKMKNREEKDILARPSIFVGTPHVTTV